MTFRSIRSRIRKLETAGRASTVVAHIFVGQDARHQESMARLAGMIGNGPVLIVSWKGGDS